MLYLDADELTDIAEYYMLLHEEEKADEAIRLATELHPESVDPQIFLARQQMFHDNLSEAHRICDAISDQHDQEVVFLNAELLIREGQEDEAHRLLENYYADLNEERAVFLYDAANVFLDYALWALARKWAERMIEEFPTNRKGQFLMADTLFSMGENEQAIATLNTLLDQDPYYIEAWNLLAEAQSASEQFTEALESVEYVLAIQQDNRQALLTKAHCLFHIGETEAAHQLYQQLLRVDSHDDTLHYFDALCLSSLEHFEEAAEALRRANEEGHGMSQEQLHIYLQQAYVESKLHHLEDAVEALKQAARICTKETTFEYHLLLGQIYLENDRFELAQKQFTLAVEQSPDRKHTMLLIGIAFGEAGHYEESAQILTAMLQYYGEEEAGSAIPYLAFCYYHLHENSLFLHYLKGSVGVSRETTEYLFSPIYPGIPPEDYYPYAFHHLYGRFPAEEE